jgi:hypothetical protein
MNPNFFNLSKRKKRDLLAELLIGKDREGMISKKELIALNRIIQESASTTAAVVAINSPVNKSVKKIPVIGTKKRQKKKKTTFYLSQEILNNLNKAEKKIRAAGEKKNLSKISRSQIIDGALSLILEEFAAQGENSRLMRILLQET